MSLLTGIILKAEEEHAIDCFIKHTPTSCLNFRVVPGDGYWALMDDDATIAKDNGRCYEINASHPLGELLAIILDKQDPVKFTDGYGVLSEIIEDQPSIIYTEVL